MGTSDLIYMYMKFCKIVDTMYVYNVICMLRDPNKTYIARDVYIYPSLAILRVSWFRVHGAWQ